MSGFLLMSEHLVKCRFKSSRNQVQCRNKSGHSHWLVLVFSLFNVNISLVSQKIKTSSTMPCTPREGKRIFSAPNKKSIHGKETGEEIWVK